MLPATDPNPPLNSAARNSVVHRKLLVAEDNAINRRVALLQLKKLGFTVDVACNGIEALRALENGDYALVLMDCQMPEMDGFEATRAIRASSSLVRNRQIPVIAMTARAMQSDREKCLAAGMDDYISKPVRAAELASLIAKWLGESKVN